MSESMNKTIGEMGEWKDGNCEWKILEERD